jgi:hypothetical protein
VVFDFTLREIKFSIQQLTNTHVVLCVCLEYIWSKKKRSSKVLKIPVEYRWSKNQIGCSPGNFPLCGNPNTAGATLSGTPLLPRTVELCRRNLILFYCPPEPPLMKMALWRGAPAIYCSAGNPPPRGNPGLKRTQTDAI